jgi:hypothetical protein
LDVTEENDKDDVCEALPGGSKDKPGYIVELFPFAHPIAHYTRLLAEVAHGETAKHLFILTRTSHPAFLIAGRDARLEVCAFQVGMAPHSVAHAQKLLEEVIRKRARLQVCRDSPTKQRLPLQRQGFSTLLQMRLPWMHRSSKSGMSSQTPTRSGGRA